MTKLQVHLFTLDFDWRRPIEDEAQRSPKRYVFLLAKHRLVGACSHAVKDHVVDRVDLEEERKESLAYVQPG